MTELPKLLKTPTSAPWNQGGSGGEQAKQLKRLLPTPQRADGERMSEQGPRHYAGQGDNPTLVGAVKKLLPTLTTDDGYRGADFRKEDRGAGGDDLLTGVVRLLPTPTSSDASSSRRETARKDHWTSKGTTLTDAALKSSGGSSSQQSGGGKPSSAGLVLNPLFSEWMIGAPEGWSDPDCLLSATEFSSKLASSSGT